MPSIQLIGLVLLSTQMMVLFLDLWSAMILGILYLSFGGIPFIFREQYGLCVSILSCHPFPCLVCREHYAYLQLSPADRNDIPRDRLRPGHRVLCPAVLQQVSLAQTPQSIPYLT